LTATGTSPLARSGVVFEAVLSLVEQVRDASVTFDKIRALLRQVEVEEEAPTYPDPEPQSVSRDWLTSIEGVSSKEPSSLAAWYVSMGDGDEE
jgi:hypothetical protein